MGLGKTIQAIAACALLHRLGKAKRVLVVTPASLKTEWEEQIRRFTTLSQRLVFGPHAVRAAYYADSNPTFFTIVNYEQVVTDTLDIIARLKPDIIVLDEAQRIKNWATKTARAVKRLQSRYAFVLTGTPVENRIGGLYSIADFLNPALFGPLFRFSREFYQLDEKGRPKEYQNLNIMQGLSCQASLAQTSGPLNSCSPKSIRSWHASNSFTACASSMPANPAAGRGDSPRRIAIMTFVSFSSGRKSHTFRSKKALNPSTELEILRSQLPNLW